MSMDDEAQVIYVILRIEEGAYPGGYGGPPEEYKNKDIVGFVDTEEQAAVAVAALVAEQERREKKRKTRYMDPLVEYEYELVPKLDF